MDKLETKECFIYRERPDLNPEMQMVTPMAFLEHRTDLYLFTKTEIEAIIGNAHSVGVDRGCYEFINRNGFQKRFSWVDAEPPTAEQYIKELLK